MIGHSMGSPRIVITGIGAVSPFGVGRERFWEHVAHGCSGTRAITDFDASDFSCRVAAPVPSVTIDDVPPIDGDDIWDPEYRADPKRYSRAALIGVIAAREAWADAGLRIGEPNAGVVIGSGGGGIDIGERQYHDFFVERGRKVTPYAIPVSIVGMVSSEISISLRLHGISHVLSCGCTSSTDAIGYSTALLRSGEADAIVSGGTDACVTPGMIFGFSRMRAVSMAYNERPAEASRPFDKGRDGFVLGEGAWMIVLEREDRARARGATIYASVDGYGSTCDAYHRVQMAPDGEEIVRAMSLAIERSGRSRESIGFVSYHGTSTVLNEGRVALRAAGLRRTRRSAGGIVGEIDDRPPAGRQRRGGRRHRRARAVARVHAADDQSARSRSGVRPRFHPEPRPSRRGRRGALQLSRVRIEEQRAGHRTRVRTVNWVIG
jgi:3-oxoacyl-[acyl-carrier-protein] synthase II